MALSFTFLKPRGLNSLNLIYNIYICVCVRAIYICIKHSHKLIHPVLGPVPESRVKRRRSPTSSSSRIKAPVDSLLASVPTNGSYFHKSRRFFFGA